MRPPPKNQNPFDVGTLVIAGVMAIGVVLAIAYFAVRAMEAEQEVQALKEESQARESESPSAAKSDPTPDEPVQANPLVADDPGPPAVAPRGNVPLTKYLDMDPEVRVLVWCMWVDRSAPELAKEPGVRKQIVLAALAKSEAAIELVPRKQLEQMAFSDLERVVDRAVAESLTDIILTETQSVPVVTRSDKMTKYAQAPLIDRVLWWERYVDSELSDLDESMRLGMIAGLAMFANRLVDAMSEETKQEKPMLEFFHEATAAFEKINKLEIPDSIEGFEPSPAI